MKSPRKPLPRLSKKRLATLDGQPGWSTIRGAKRRPKARNDARREKEFARAYGSKERVEFVKALSCVGCYKGPCENHHIQTGGAGRRADASLVVPTCRQCHADIHAYGRIWFETAHGVELEIEALLTEQAWQRHLAGSSLETS